MSDSQDSDEKAIDPLCVGRREEWTRPDVLGHRYDIASAYPVELLSPVPVLPGLCPWCRTDPEARGCWYCRPDKE